ncbi:ABC transporter B family member 11-like protein [Rhizoclosmatium globosum]|uniref:ABC transporter B family member 11-like protein n=1 Tax=Rhizoclosmatium globosum TaxID=329046 RepID=A0A1Y2BGH3_9FUNG|nr:ABC transporter B family member 11-like protein [Rhizoclosmatium globosum]|eukprot:ORY33913.1 ABC transporter B family member 11-like protein [Rhizoclosmatium globosum]
MAQEATTQAPPPPTTKKSPWILAGRREVEGEVDEGEVEKKEDKPAPPPKLPFFSLFKYADATDKLLFLGGILFSVVAGGLSPFLFLVFGNLLGAFGLIYTDPNAFDSELRKYILFFVYLGLGSFVLNYIGTLCWRLTGERQSLRIRTGFLESVLRQDVAWFDERRAGDLASRLSTDTSLIQSGISEKVGLALLYLSSFLASFVVAYTQGWKMALVVTAAVPALGIVLASTQTDYAEAGALATEVLGSIRTVFAFGGQKREGDAYEKLLVDSQGIRRKKIFSTGIGFGTVNLMIYAFIALALWYGATLLVKGEYQGQNVMIIFFTLLVGSFSIGNLGPYATSFASAQGAAYEVYSIIDRNQLRQHPRFAKEIEFRNVKFNYASRPDVQVLNGLNLKIPYGKTVALVGSSGSGKSTIMQMLQRFYDPVEGSVLIDGVDLKDANVRSFRSQLGVVSQEPVLFRYSVKENIRFGKAANAYDFIKELPEGFDNDVGERGSLLSGGQKQRVAIARAIIRNPPILLLDEATSALDSQSEQIVQDALEKASVGRTTIVIAHRLSTIKDADLIVVLEKGEVAEMGTHNELLAKKGRYHELVSRQELKKNEKEEDADIERDTTPTPLEKAAVVGLSTSTELVNVAVTDGKEKTPVVEKEKVNFKNLLRLIGYNSQQWYFLAISATAATGLGLAFPLYSLFFGKLIAAFFDPNVSSLQDQINTWCLVFLVIGIVGFLATFTQIVFIGLYGTKVFVKIRVMAMRNILRQEIGFFDEGKNSSSNLSETLGRDVETLEVLMDQTVAQAWSSIVNAIAGTIIGLYYSWKLTLVALALLPVPTLGIALETQAKFGSNSKLQVYFDRATFIANEAIFNIRTVISLGLEDFFIQKFKDELAAPYKISIRAAFVASFGPAFSQCAQFFTYAVSYWYGGTLVKSNDTSFQSMNIVIQSVFFMSLAIGQVGALAPSITKALLAANKVFALVDRVTLMDTTVGKKVEAPEITGDVSLSKVKFSYPTRSEVQVLKGVDMDVKPGMTIGLVGASGCGKSTIISLVMRFYDPTTGTLSFGTGSEAFDAKTRQLESIRSFMAIVSQEPVLFARTLAENIRYGNENATQADVIQAAKDANIYDFISTLPDAFETFAGERGTQLSGGQKQRLAIARALVRNPKFLLLDEATSALDTESESVVQDALDKASVGRTTLIVAHRLSTIQNADCIYVFKKGRVAEKGTHQELLQKKGIYFALVEQQSLAANS